MKNKRATIKGMKHLAFSSSRLHFYFCNGATDIRSEKPNVAYQNSYSIF